jgi:hypothetical protein
LKKKLHLRANGYLCDRADGQQITQEQLEQRISIVAEHIESFERPKHIPGFSELFDVFRNIPDTSDEHRQTVERFGAALQATAEVGRVKAMIIAWHEIVGRGLPEDVKGAVQPRIEALEAQLAEAQRQAEERQKHLAISANPWWRLASDIGKIAGGDETARIGLLQGAFNALRFISVAFPEIMPWLKERATLGGLQAVISAVRQEVLTTTKEKNDEPDAGTLLLPEDHRTWTREHWITIVAQYRSLAAACRDLHLSDKTIKKYLATHGIDPMWGVAVDIAPEN